MRSRFFTPTAVIASIVYSLVAGYIIYKVQFYDYLNQKRIDHLEKINEIFMTDSIDLFQSNLDFFILTDSETQKLVQHRLLDILNDSNDSNILSICLQKQSFLPGSIIEGYERLRREHLRNQIRHDLFSEALQREIRLITVYGGKTQEFDKKIADIFDLVHTIHHLDFFNFQTAIDAYAMTNINCFANKTDIIKSIEYFFREWNNKRKIIRETIQEINTTLSYESMMGFNNFFVGEVDRYVNMPFYKKMFYGFSSLDNTFVKEENPLMQLRIMSNIQTECISDCILKKSINNQ